MKAVRPFPPQLNPIIVKEVRMRMRGVQPYAILTLFLVVMAAAGYGIYLLMLRQASFGGMVLSFQVGQSLFRGLALCAVLLMVFLAPAMTSGAISGEREHLTYEMLLATPLRPARILWGKLVATLSYIFLLIFASVPVFSVVLMFGGVAPKDMIKALLLLLVTAITYGTIGMFCSALMRRTSQATVLSYVLILLLIGSTAMAGILWSYFGATTGQAVPPQLLYLNPFSALISIVTITPDSTSGMFLGGNLLNLPTIGVVHYGPNGPMVLPIYRATLLFYTLLTIALYWISSHLVLPRHRWRPRRGDLRFVLLLVGIIGLIWLIRDWWFVLPPQNP